MSESPQTPPTPPAPPVGSAAPAAPRRRLAALPFVATAAVAVLFSLLFQALLPRLVAPVGPLIATNTASVVQPPAPSPELTPPPPSPPAISTAVLAQEVIDLKEESHRLWSALYLMRAVVQLGDAEDALQLNDPAEVRRLLPRIRRSLDQAYSFSAEQEKGSIDSFRVALSKISEDLSLRPEGTDRRLRELRLLVLSLVDEGG